MQNELLLFEDITNANIVEVSDSNNAPDPEENYDSSKSDGDDDGKGGIG